MEKLEKKYKPEGQKFEMTGGAPPYFSRAALCHAKESGEILEGVAAICDENYNLILNLGCMTGIIRRDDVTYDPNGTQKDIAIITRVGKVVCFQVVDFDTDPSGREYAVLSRKTAQKECVENYLEQLCVGDVIPAKVTHLEQFGAFVDIGCGCISLLSLDCISVSRISHPRDRFFPGMSIYVAVKSIDTEENRIYVTHKELLGTWEENAAAFSVGMTVRGIVRSIEEYGIFIELAPNLAGLSEYRPDLRLGQNVAVYIKNILPHRMKIKLVVVDTDSLSLPVRHFDYFIPAWHLDSFQYSPQGCEKLIRTDFGETSAQTEVL